MENTDTKSSTNSSTNLGTTLAAQISHVQNIFNTYLSLDPSEVSRMTVLAEQMIDGDQGLYSRQNMKGHLTASALVLDQNNRVLLVLHNQLKRWLQPGGHLDQGEDPEVGARRELIEETGLTYDVIELHPLHHSAQRQATTAASSMRAKVLPVDIDSHLIPVNPAKGEGQHLHHDFQYVYLLKSSQISLKMQEEEISNLKWVAIEDLLEGQYGVRLKRVAQKIIDSTAR